MSYRQFCSRYSEWTDSRKLTFHIQRYPEINLELDFAEKTLCIHNRHDPDETTKVTIFVATLTYSDYFYTEGMTECDIKNWIRVNNNALAFFGGVTPTITPDNCKVAVAHSKGWISPVVNKGNPRLIDNLMTDALTIGFQQDRKVIDAKTIRAAVDNQGLY